MQRDSAQNPPSNVLREHTLEELVTPKLRQLIARVATQERADLHQLVLNEIERPLIRLTLEKMRGNQLRTADLLGINRNTLRKKIRELGIDVRAIKDE